MLVIDASIILALFLPDEGDTRVVAVVSDFRTNAVYAPGHLILEVANGLLMAVRRKRIDEALRQHSLNQFLDLNLELDHMSKPTVATASTLADQFNLTIYDAAYLELAQRFKQPLATLDRKLAAAAFALGLLHPAIASSSLSS
jgi:predicted nucleic acid-binding protein